MSFRLKTVLGIAAIEVVLLAILIVSGVYYLKTSNESELLRSGQVTARLFSTMIADAVVATDLATLDTLVSSTLKNDGLVYVRVRNSTGTVLAQGGDEGALAARFKPDASIADTSDDRRLDVQAPIAVAGKTFGSVEIGLSTLLLEATISDALNWMLSIAASEIALVAVFGLLLGTILTRQLARLRDAARLVAAGEFGHQLDVHGRDELADTTISFNKMSTSLAAFAQEAEAARRTAEAGRDYAESVLHDAMDSMPQGVVIVNKDERVEFANTAFIDRYPETADKLAAGPAFAEVAAMTLPRIRASGDQDIEDRVAGRLEKLRNVDAHRHWESEHESGLTLFNAQRRMSGGGVVVVENDITELKAANERNRKLELELLQAEKMKSLGTLAGGTAHEFNNLLVPMIGLTELVMEDLPEDSIERTNLEKVIEAGGRARQLVAQILSFSRAEDPDQPIDRDAEIVDLGAAVREALDLVRTTTPSTIDLDLEVPDAPCRVSIDPTQLQQIIMNLVANASHAMDGQVGRIALSVARADETAAVLAEAEAVEPGRAYAVLRVRDTGCGMDEETVQRIFEPFFTTKEVGKGTGMGLAVIHSIITRAGGVVDVTSAPSEGTTFDVYLPIEAGEDRASADEPSARPETADTPEAVAI